MREFTAGDAEFTEIRLEKVDGVATITIARPQALNAYSTKSLRELAMAFTDASWDDTIAVVVLTGEGERAFCAGGDVKEYVDEFVTRPRDYWKWIGLFRTYLETVLHCGKPVIARINGLALGGGNETQLACDLAVMAEHATLGQVGTSVGSVAAAGATQWLPLVVGDRRAREMLFLNRRLTAREALQWGLVNAIAPTVKHEGRFVENPSADQVRSALERSSGYSIDLAELDAKVAAWVKELKEKFPECLRYTKTQVNHHKESAWHPTIGHAQDWLALHFATPEPGEGMRAFVEKRRPDYAGLRRRWANDASPEYPFGPPALTCPSCRTAGLPAAFAFCGSCGAKLRT
jgi:enoyl-CoA hydratase/carnithine racemase